MLTRLIVIPDLESGRQPWWLINYQALNQLSEGIVRKAGHIVDMEILVSVRNNVRNRIVWELKEVLRAY